MKGVNGGSCFSEKSYMGPISMGRGLPVKCRANKYLWPRQSSISHAAVMFKELGDFNAFDTAFQKGLACAQSFVPSVVWLYIFYALVSMLWFYAFGFKTSKQNMANIAGSV